jgi:hypothetical protein
VSGHRIHAPRARRVRAELLASLRRDPALAKLRSDDPSDPIVALCDAFAALAALIDFYQERILDEAFLASAEQESSIELLYHSLGNRFPANGAAVTALAYHLSDKIAGVEAVTRARAGGSGAPPGTGATPGEAASALAQAAAAANAVAAAADPANALNPANPANAVLETASAAGLAPAGSSASASAPSVGVASLIPPAAQVRAVPGSGERPPTFITLEQLVALVGASRLAVSLPEHPRPPVLRPDTTELELAGTRTGLSVGQPILIVADGEKEQTIAPWIVLLSSVVVDSERGSTRIGWAQPLGERAGKLASATSPTVYGFASSSALVGAGAPAWSSLSLAQQLAAPTPSDGTAPILGGLGESRDGGRSWTARAAGVPPGVVFSAVAAYEGHREGQPDPPPRPQGIVLAAAGAGELLRAEGTGALAPVTLGGGARRAIVFLGGRRERMLAAGAGATVLQSIDDGRTWSPVTGGAPELEAGTASPQKVISNQLPSVMVRSVIEEPTTKPSGEAPPDLVAATDAGIYFYEGTDWRAGKLTGPVFDLLAVPATPPTYPILAATTDGVYILSAKPTKCGEEKWEKWGTKLEGRVYALAWLQERCYAATDAGVMSRSSQEGAWQKASGAGKGALPRGAVTALVAAAGTLFAGTAEGVYASRDPGSTWTPSDRWLAFTLDPAVLQAPVPTEPVVLAPTPALRAAFAGEGIVLGPHAELIPGNARYRLIDGERAYELISSAAGWEVWQLAPLGPISALGADASSGSVLAAGAALRSAAGEWPGFAVNGHSVEVTPPSRTIVAGTRAVLEQRTAAQLRAQALDVSAVEQDNALLFGRETPLTRVSFKEKIPFDAYPRRSSTLWTGGAPLALFTPPAGGTRALCGKEIPLAKPLLTPVPAGRLGAVTGQPIGLAVLALGGAMRIPPSTRTDTSAPRARRQGPVQADVRDLAVDTDGVVYLATPEGVVRVHADAPQGRSSQRLLLGRWPTAPPAAPADREPPGPAPAVAVALLGTPGAMTVLAASSWGLSKLEQPPDADMRWEPVLPRAQITLMAAAGDAVAIACADGSVALCEHPTAQTHKWQELPPLDDPATALLLDGQRVTAANATGVHACSPGGAWQDMGQPPGSEAITAFVRDGEGTLWGGVRSGLVRQAPNSTQWQHEPAVSEAVEALALDPLLEPLAIGATGVMHRIGGAWKALATSPGAPVSAAAMGLDQTLWVGMHAELAIELHGGASQPLPLTTVLREVGLEPADIAALDQGALPAMLAEALAAAGVKLEPARTALSGSSETGGWLLRCGSTVELIALRGDGSRRWAVVSEPQLTLYPTGGPVSDGEVERWPVLVEGSEGFIHARAEQLVRVPATSAAPSFAETVLVASVSSSATAGSILTLQEPLAHVYDPATVLVNLNVASAAQGQAVSIPIGSGDPGAIHQSFTVPSPVAALGPTPSTPEAPVRSTLSITVSGQQWQETPSLGACGPEDPVYLGWHNADGTMIVHFGDGVHGARLPRGEDNVVASYIQGGGPAGEVAQGTLIQPLDRPQLVTEVHNPEPARVPPTATAAATRVASMHALDGIVTLSDYEDLALAQAEVTSAAAQLADGRALIVTIAAAGGASAKLVARVQAALGTLAASGLPVKVLAARLVAVQASIEVIAADASLEGQLRSELGGLCAARPGAPLRAAQVLSVATAVPGVTAAAVRRWSRPGAHAASPTAIPAAGASWPVGAPAPRAAELLTIDASKMLQIEIVRPEVMPS